MTAKEIVRQILDDGIMTEDKAIQLINNHTISVIGEAIGEVRSNKRFAMMSPNHVTERILKRTQRRMI